MFHPIFISKFFSNFINPLGIFVRANWKGCRKIIRSHLCSFLRGFFHTKCVAVITAKSSFRQVFHSPCHIKKYLWVIITFYESNIFLITCFMNKTLKLFYPFGIFCFWCDIGIIIKNRNFKILCQIFKNIAAARRAACMKEKSWAIFSLSTLLLNFICDFIQYLLIIYFLNIICIHLNSPCNFISSKYP